MISGGSAPNIVPARCEAQLDFRFLPSQKATDIEEAIKARAAEVERANEGAVFTFERMMMVGPIAVSPDHLLVQRLQDTAGAVLGTKPKLKGMSGSTVAKPLVRTGTAAVGFGPGEQSQAHAANESIAVEELLNFARILGGFLIEEES
jgi:acetylornithine deacetylase/succinyl-diaminopimelate desuccinylase-like protein